MLIKASNVSLSSTHEVDETTTRQLRLVAAPRADTSFAKLLEIRTRATPAQLLEPDDSASESTATHTGKGPFEALLEFLLGLSDSLSGTQGQDAGTAAGSPSRTFQLEVFTRQTESESCTFAASGNVCLADGSTRQFSVGYQMERNEGSVSGGTAALRDPLVLDLAAPSPGLSTQRADIDLDGDGKTESVRMPPAGSALLFDDRNHNGRADDGSELFGPRSGNGFQELAKLDGDGNGWIDSGDRAFADLKLWQISEDGTSRVRSLAEAGVGALATANAATPFSFKEGGESVGQMRASSVWLGESADAGTVREIDVAVVPHGPGRAANA